MHPRQPRQAPTPMPAKKPQNQHKVDVTLSLKPDHLAELERFDDYGYRSRSHMADEAIAVLLNLKKRLKAQQEAETSRNASGVGDELSRTEGSGRGQ